MISNQDELPCTLCKTIVRIDEPYTIFCDPRPGEYQGSAIYHVECYKKTLIENIASILSELKRGEKRNETGKL